MFKVNLKLIFFIKRLLNRQKDIFVTAYGHTALTADQVMMMALFGMVINGVVACLTFKYTAVIFQQVKRAVNSRLVDAGHLFLHGSDNVLGCNMGSGIMYYVYYQPALRCQF
jgi:hypothetical protein